MNMSSSGECRRNDVWVPGQGKYLVSLKFTTLRDFVHRVYAQQRSSTVKLEDAIGILQTMWSDLGLSHISGRSHTYRHFHALRVLGFVSLEEARVGYALTEAGALLLSLGESGVPLNCEERRAFAAAMFSPPETMTSPLLAFADLFLPGVRTPEDFVALGTVVTFIRHHDKRLEIVTANDRLEITERDDIDQILRGCRELFKQADLIGELPSVQRSTKWTRLLFPVYPLAGSSLETVTRQVEIHCRQQLEDMPRIGLPELSADLRPQFRLSKPDFDRIMHILADDRDGEFYFDRVSLPLITSRKEAYVRIEDAWRASITRA